MSMENIAGARKPAKREDEHTVAGEHRMMRRADREVTDPERIAAIIAACDIVEVAYADAEGLTIVQVAATTSRCAATPPPVKPSWPTPPTATAEWPPPYG